MASTHYWDESKCINCSAALDDGNNQLELPSPGGFYTLSCTSRVRYPLIPASVSEIPVGRALSTIFNLKPPSSTSLDSGGGTSRSRNDPGTDIDDPDENHSDGESALFLLLEDSPSLPICFVCHLVLNDLYRTYTEFSQLRKRNSFLGAKLIELENISKVSRKPEQTDNSEKNAAGCSRSVNKFHSNSNSASNDGIEAAEHVDVKCELFDEDDLQEEVQDEFQQSDASISITGDLPGDLETQSFLFTSKPKELFNCKRKRKRTRSSKNPVSSSSLFSTSASHNFVTETQNNVEQQVQIKPVNPEDAFYSATSATVFSTETVDEDKECYPTDAFDPLNPATPRYCTKINKEGKECGGLLRFYNRRKKIKRDNSIQIRPTLRCSKTGCQKCYFIRKLNVLEEQGGPAQVKHQRSINWTGSQLQHNGSVNNVSFHLPSSDEKWPKRGQVDYGTYYNYAPNFATCRLCGDSVPRKHGNTTGLMVHLKNHHSIDVNTKVKPRKEEQTLKAIGTPESLPLENQSSAVVADSITVTSMAVDTGRGSEHGNIVSSKLNRRGQLKINYPEHFEFVTSVAGEEKAICRICSKIVARKYCNTSSMRSHLFNKHKMKVPFETADRMDSEADGD